MLSRAVIFAELVDCDSMDDGCNGGLPENAYKAIESLGGLETEKDYPYEGEDEKCHFRKGDVKVTIQGAVNITKNETQMAQWLYKNGPISIGINANAMQVIICMLFFWYALCFCLCFAVNLVCCEVWFVKLLKCNFVKNSKVTSCN
jgi:hypothetical protein